MIKTNDLAGRTALYLRSSLCFDVLVFWPRSSSMIPRSMRSSGVDLPGVGPREVPLIGYRALQTELDGSPDQLWKESEHREADHHTQVRGR